MKNSCAEGMFFYVERFAFNKMLKFSAFHEFYARFFHLNYCAGYAYYLKKIKK